MIFLGFKRYRLREGFSDDPMSRDHGRFPDLRMQAFLGLPPRLGYRIANRTLLVLPVERRFAGAASGENLYVY
jgi:hypothetical protein